MCVVCVWGDIIYIYFIILYYNIYIYYTKITSISDIGITSKNK